jgi:phosphoenolpyruvate synthase/pyruvate phosphate dikinase
MTQKGSTNLAYIYLSISQQLLAKLRGEILSTPLDSHVVAMIDAYIIGLPNTKLAVRSSASSEDGAEFSAAGLFQSFLNLSTTEEVRITETFYVFQVTTAILKCYASTFSADILALCGKFGKWPEMGIIIQPLVNSEVSGVAFTINPVTKQKDEIVIESLWGQGKMY